MNEKKQKHLNRKPEGKPASSKLSKNEIINEVFTALNIFLLLAVVYQGYLIIDKYSEKAENSLADGRTVIINAKTNQVESLTLSDEEILAINPNHAQELEKKAQEEAEKKAEEEQKLLAEKASKEKKIDYTKANLAIVVTEIGQTKRGFDLAKTLPKEATFAFSPYSDELQKKIDSAVADGRQVLLNLMLEPSGFPIKDSGPLTLLTSADPAKNISKLEDTIGEYKNYIGFFTNKGEVMTPNLDVITPILKRIKDENKFFGYYRVPVNSYLENDVKAMAVDIFFIDYNLDDNLDKKEILEKLAAVKDDIINKKKKVIVSLHSYKVSVSTLNKWLKDNEEEEIQIAPISYFITDN